MYHQLKSSFFALTTTSAAADGHLMRSAITSRFEREESVEDRTEVKKPAFWNRGKNYENSQR